jgi:hypothetical protein
MITLGRQSGILRVIRGHGPSREIGQIKFRDGEPVAALLGNLTNMNALNVLKNWGECVYAFDEQPVHDMPEDEWAGGASPSFSDSGRLSAPNGFSSTSWPTYGTPTSYPHSQPSPTPNSVPTSSSLPGLTSQPGYTSPYGPGYTTQTPSGYPGDPARPEGQFGAAPQQAPRPPQGGQIHPDLLLSVPRRTMMGEQADQLPLDRRERMVLLLVDGRRNLSDLARLTRRNEREILAVLNHLHGLGLVLMGN